MEGFDFLAIGDTYLDDFLFIERADAKVVGNKNERLLCLNYGAKIPVEGHRDIMGGNAANASVTAARLKLKTALWSVFGDDETAAKAVKSLKHECVSALYLEQRPGLRSSRATVLDYARDRTILVASDPHFYRPRRLSPAKWVYLTAAGNHNDELYRFIRDYAGECGAQIAFQPGTLQLRLGAAQASELLEKSVVVIMNLQEAQEYTKRSTNRPVELLQALRWFGPQIVAITDGANGAYAGDGQQFWSMNIDRAVRPLELTGAGDAWAAAFVCALFYGCDIPTAMRWGTVNSASVIQKIGAQPGILKLAEMKKQLRQAWPALAAKKLPAA